MVTGKIDVGMVIKTRQQAAVLAAKENEDCFEFRHEFAPKRKLPKLYGSDTGSKQVTLHHLPDMFYFLLKVALPLARERR